MNLDLTLESLVRQGLLPQADYDNILNRLAEKESAEESAKNSAKHAVAVLLRKFKKWSWVNWQPEVHFSLTTKSPVKVTEKIINFNLQSLLENSEIILSANLPITFCKFIADNLLKRPFTDVSLNITGKTYEQLVLPIRSQIETFTVYRYECPNGHIRELSTKMHRQLKDSSTSYFDECGEFVFQQRIEIVPDIIIEYDIRTKTYFAYFNDSKEQVSSMYEHADPHTLLKEIKENYPNQIIYRK